MERVAEMGRGQRKVARASVSAATATNYNSDSTQQAAVQQRHGNKDERKQNRGKVWSKIGC